MAPKRMGLPQRGQTHSKRSICPDILARLDGYSDRGERNPMRLSESRAHAVEQYYIENGISANRLLARGLGRDPLAGKGVDGQRNRRVDSSLAR